MSGAKIFYRSVKVALQDIDDLLDRATAQDWKLAETVSVGGTLLALERELESASERPGFTFAPKSRR